MRLGLIDAAGLRLAAAPTSEPSSEAALWTPAEITTLLWYDADDSASITLDGSNNVQQWNDKSGSGMHLAHPTAGNRPAYDTTTTLNGLPVVRTNATGPKFLYADSIDAIRANRDRSFFGVYRCRVAGELLMLGTRTSIEGINDSTKGFGLTWRPSSTSANSGYFHFTSSYDDVFWAGVSDENQGVVFGLEKTGGVGANNVAAYRNGTALSLIDSAIADSVEESAGNHFAVGLSSVAGYTADLAELICIESAPTTATRQRIEGYLAWKWGLEANLPSGHPYELAAPTV